MLIYFSSEPSLSYFKKSSPAGVLALVGATTDKGLDVKDRNYLFSIYT